MRFRVNSQVYLKQFQDNCHMPVDRGGTKPSFSVFLRTSTRTTHFRRGGRAVECTGLENQHRLIAYPGFESLPLRHTVWSPTVVSVGDLDISKKSVIYITIGCLKANQFLLNSPKYTPYSAPVSFGEIRGSVLKNYN